MSSAAPAPAVSATSAVVVSSGVAHDFAASSAVLVEVLADAGVDARVETDVEAALLGLDAPDDEDASPLVVLNMLRWSMQVDRYAHLRDEWALTTSPQVRAALVGHVERGGGLLALHGASICFDDWPEWRDLLGARWDWAASSHPPIEETPVRVALTGVQHPIVDGLTDFEVVDEVYGFLDLAPDVVGLMTAAHTGADHPLLWAREVGAGRVVYDALGHDVRSYDSPMHRTIVQRAARWAVGLP